jgi:hypothetical protein
MKINNFNFKNLWFNKDGVFGGRITISKGNYETTSQTTELTVGHSKNEPKNDIEDKTMHETSKITKIKLDDQEFVV